MITKEELQGLCASTETLLAERKARNFTTFDARPCFSASLDDIDLDLFQHDYLPKAVDAAVLVADDRPIERKLESLRFFNSAYGLPTNAAVLLFGKDPRRFFPGAYVQYVSFGGLDKAATILNEHPFKGPIMRILSQIDLFIETTIARKRPVFVTALREETRRDYPKGAIRELVMNAIMHRDYQGNATIHFYQYAFEAKVALAGKGLDENLEPAEKSLHKTVEKTVESEKLPENDPTNDLINDLIKLFDLIKENPSLNYGEYGKILGVSEATIKRRLSELKRQGKIVRVGANKNGHWEVVE